MSKIGASQWRRFIGVLIGFVVFVSLVRSPAVTSSSQLDNFVVDSRESSVERTKSFEEIVTNLPSAKQIRAMSLAPHPRLLASESRFAEIKKLIKTDEKMRQWYDKLYEEAETFLDEEPSKYEFQDEIRMLDVSRLVLERVTTLALVYRINQDERFLQRAWEELKAASEFPNWNPSHFLDTAEMTHAFAIGYDWMYEYWNEERRKIISSAIVEKGLVPAFNDYTQEIWWTKTTNNWNQVCNGGIGIGALAVLDINPKLSSEILDRGLQRLPQAMKKYEPDGAWSEGPGYWHYATKYNSLFLASLETSFNNDFALSEITGFSETGSFPIYMTGALGTSFNFSDSKQGRFRSPQLFWMANKFDKPIYSFYQQEVARPEAMDLIWYEPLEKKISLKQPPLDRYFRNSEIVSMRSSWTNPQGIFVGFKAGDNKFGHSNLDLGTFVLDASGVRWAVELGSDEYNLPGYFDREEKRWQYYRMRAEGQNTFVINPDSEPDQNPEARSKIIDFNSQPDRVSAVADLTPAYASDVKRLLRKITLDRKQQKVLIQDNIIARKPINAWWFMHTEADIELDRDGKKAVLFQDDVSLPIEILDCDRCYFEILDAKPMEASPNPSGQESNRGFKKLAIKLDNFKQERLKIAFGY